jgi:hypothetical protein
LSYDDHFPCYSLSLIRLQQILFSH